MQHEMRLNMLIAVCARLEAFVATLKRNGFTNFTGEKSQPVAAILTK